MQQVVGEEAERQQQPCSVEVVFGGGGGGECDMDSVEEKNEEMGSLCTCFQGNRGLLNTGRLDFLFSMCCTALWQNTADPSNDSKTLMAGPFLQLWLKATIPRARCGLLCYSIYYTLWRCMMIESKPQIGQYAWIKHTWSFAGDVTVCAPHHHHHHRFSPTSPRRNDLLLWSAVSRPPAWLVGGGTGKCLSLWETLALWSHEYIIGGQCAMREVHWDAVQSKDSNRRILINSAS